MNKPEWFELTEKDGGKTHFEVKRGLKSFALAIPLLAIGAGVVFAQSSNEAPSKIESVTATASAQPSITAQLSVPAPTQPSIAKPPIGGGDDDEFEGEHRRGEHREGGEHEDFGDDD